MVRGVGDGVGALGLGGAVLRVVEVEAVADVTEETGRRLLLPLGQPLLHPWGERWGREVREGEGGGEGRKSARWDEPELLFILEPVSLAV